MKSCTPNYLPREFSCVLYIAVHIPPQTDSGTKTALNELYTAISKQENAHPEAALLLTWDFLPACFKCATRGKIPLDHLYSPHRAVYKALPRPPFGKSDQNSILLIPAYKQKLRQVISVTRSIRKWSEDADAKLQDCFASTHWYMFRDSSDSIEEYPRQSLASSISASMTLSPQWQYVQSLWGRRHRCTY